MASVAPPLPPKKQSTITHNNPPTLPPKARQSSASSVSENTSSNNNNIQPPSTLRTNISSPKTTSITKPKTTASPAPSTNATKLPTTQKQTAPPLPPKKTVKESTEGALTKPQSEKVISASTQSTSSLGSKPASKDSSSISRPVSKDDKLVMKAKFNTTREPRRSTSPSAKQTFQTTQVPPKANRPLPTDPSNPPQVPTKASGNVPKQNTKTFASPAPVKQPLPKEEPKPAVPLTSFKSFSAEDASSSNDFFCPDFTVSNPAFSTQLYHSTTPTVDFSNYPCDNNNTRNRSMSVDSTPVAVGAVRDTSALAGPSYGNNLGWLGNASYNTKYKGEKLKTEAPRESLAGCSFACEVVSGQTIVDSSKRKEKFTVYTVVVNFAIPDTCKNPGNYSWKIFRRYKQFFELDCKMREFGVIVSNNQLPPKNNKDKFNQDFIEYRRKRLQGYLEELATYGWKLFADPKSTFQLLKFLAPVQFNDEKPPGFVLPFKVDPC